MRVSKLLGCAKELGLTLLAICFAVIFKDAALGCSVAIGTMLMACVAVLLKPAKKPMEAPNKNTVLGLVKITGLADVNVLAAIRERGLASALARATKYNLVLSESSERGFVFLARNHDTKQNCNKMMMFFRELNTDFAKTANRGLSIHFVIARGNDPQTAEQLGTQALDGEIVLVRDLVSEIPSLKLNTRVLGQMRFAQAA